MNDAKPKAKAGQERELTSELLILPDGQVLARNLTGTLATLLGELAPHGHPFNQSGREASPHPRRH
jgi:hypothetical protein